MTIHDEYCPEHAPELTITDEYYQKHAPEFKKYLKPSKEQRKKHPRLLYLVQYGDNEPTMRFGPDETYGERVSKYRQRKQKKELQGLLKKTKGEVKGGKQRKLSSYFKKWTMTWVITSTWGFNFGDYVVAVMLNIAKIYTSSVPPIIRIRFAGPSLSCIVCSTCYLDQICRIVLVIFADFFSLWKSSALVPIAP